MNTNHRNRRAEPSQRVARPAAVLGPEAAPGLLSDPLEIDRTELALGAGAIFAVGLFAGMLA